MSDGTYLRCMICEPGCYAETGGICDVCAKELIERIAVLEEAIKKLVEVKDEEQRESVD